MNLPSPALRLLGLAALLVLVAPSPAEAQRLSREHYEDVHNGYRFKVPDDWTVIPPQAPQLEAGITLMMEGDGRLMTVDGRTYKTKPGLHVIRISKEDLRALVRGMVEEEHEGEFDEEVVDAAFRQFDMLRFVLPQILGGVRGFDFSDPDADKKVKARNKLVGRQRTWEGSTRAIETVIDTYEFELEDAFVYLIFNVPEKDAKKWLRSFRSVGKSFEVIERERSLEFEEGGTYKDILAYHEELVSRTPGWRVLPTPSERFLIKTSSDNTQFIEEVIERLEKSRDLFERDFPPPAPIEEVSVVRICGTEEEFHSYGRTSAGVGGWFSPTTAELVLFDYRATDRNATYAVMSHEAFHQYCHYLFGRSEAHRWFDEGHGDYYGGVKFGRRKAEVTPKMPAGFDRLSVIKGMIQRDEQVPLERHLNFTHREWQNQGPSNVSCYAQSWSIIYMLRKGALGDVPSRIWEDEYADIIPNYINALSREFRALYAAKLAEREALAEAEGRELTKEERELDRDDLERDEVDAVWKIAMDESWGKIDLDEFEENWLTFVRKYL